MFKRKKSSVDRAGGSTAGGAGPTGVSVGWSATVLFLLIALALVLSGGVIFVQQQRQAQQAELSQARLAAAVVADRLSGHIALYNVILEKRARSRVLAGLLQKQERGRIQGQEKLLVQLLPEVQGVRYLPSSLDQAEPDFVQKMTFAELDMFRQVRSTARTALAEVHQPGTGRQYIALASPIIDPLQGELVGVALLALSFDAFNQALATVGKSAGYYELQQVVEKESVALLRSKEKAAAGEIDGTVPVQGSIWRVAYWPDGADGILGELLLPAVLMVVLAIIGALVLFCASRLQRALKWDGVAIVSLVEQMMAGNSVQLLTRTRLSELRMTVEELAKLGLRTSQGPRLREGDTDAIEVTHEESIGIPSQKIAPRTGEEESALPVVTDIPPECIFRAYDIRGVVGETLTAAYIEVIGQAIGSEAAAKGEQTVIVARDGHDSSEELGDALCRGLMASGRDVVDLGLVPTPVLYFATHFLDSKSGVMVTGSNNPAGYNGLKIVINGETLLAEAIQGLRQRIIQGDLQRGDGDLQKQDMVPGYLGRVTDDIQLLTPLKLVLDCGNGAASVIAPTLLRALGCEVIELFCEVDGSFPNHHPDPSQPENMKDLIEAVKAQGADLGVAFDADADRLGVVDSEGNIIWPDRLLMLLARDVLMRQPGADVIYDVKSSRHLAGEILAYGGRPIMWKSGHSPIKAKLRETGALLAGDMSGHIFFGERWYGFDDGLYACARLLEVLSAEGVSSAEVFAQLPESLATPELIMRVPEGTAAGLVTQFIDRGEFPSSKQITIDGIRVEFGDGWGLAHPSNTTSAVTFRFEADSQAVMDRIQQLFRERFHAIEPGLNLPF